MNYTIWTFYLRPKYLILYYIVFIFVRIRITSEYVIFFFYFFFPILYKLIGASTESKYAAFVSIHLFKKLVGRVDVGHVRTSFYRNKRKFELYEILQLYKLLIMQGQCPIQHLNR